MNSAQIESFFATLQAANPMPVTELEYTSLFELLAAVLLHQNAAGLHQVFGFAAVQANRLDVAFQPLQPEVEKLLR